jgi:hypothetical protein
VSARAWPVLPSDEALRELRRKLAGDPPARCRGCGYVLGKCDCADLRAAARSVTCPLCGAEPGDPCRDLRGRAGRNHAGRYDEVRAGSRS